MQLRRRANKNVPVTNATPDKEPNPEAVNEKVKQADIGDANATSVEGGKVQPIGLDEAVSVLDGDVAAGAASGPKPTMMDANG